jgi:hypothetical protein
MARILGFRKILHKNIAGKITIPENLKDIVDGLSSGTIQATVDGKKKDFPYVSFLSWIKFLIIFLV